MIVLVVDGQEMSISVPDAHSVTAEDMNRIFEKAGVGGRIHCPSAQEIAAQEAEHQLVGRFIEQGRKAYTDAFNWNGPNAPPVCPYPEQTTEAVGWWGGWNTAAAMDAPDSY